MSIHSKAGTYILCISVKTITSGVYAPRLRVATLKHEYLHFFVQVRYKSCPIGTVTQVVVTYYNNIVSMFYGLQS